MTNELLALLRCPECDGALHFEVDKATCGAHTFPVRAGVPRLLPADLRELLDDQAGESLRARTYRSFGFEWSTFGAQLQAYERNFLWYVEPLGDASLASLRVLDAGCGMGRHAHHFLKAGAMVVAFDASRAVEVAAANNSRPDVAFVQGDLLKPPVAKNAFDLVCCLGVLHHIEDTLGGLRALVSAARPGGQVLIYLYHDATGASALRRAVLSLVGLARYATIRLPFRLLRVLTWVLAVFLWLGWVGPLKLLSRVGAWREVLAPLPLGQYLDYPFRVLWNDQFDRFSAPLEKRYSRTQVEELMAAAGLVDVTILGGYGWRAAGRKPIR